MDTDNNTVLCIIRDQTESDTLNIYFVDGGITKDTAKIVTDAGANVLVAGTAVFGKEDYKQAIEELRGKK